MAPGYGDGDRTGARGGARQMLRYLACDLQLLGGFGDDHRYFRSVSLNLRRGAVVQHHRQVVQTQAHELQPVADAPPHAGRVLADTAGKDHRIHPPHRRRIGPDVFAHTVGIEVDGKLRVSIARRRAILDIAHVRTAGQPLQPAVVIQRRLDLLDAQTQLPVQIAERARVHIARAGAHHQPLERGQAHRRFEAFTQIYGAHAGAVAQMHRDQPQVLQSLAHRFRGAPRDVMMRGAMKSVAPQPRLAPFGGHGIGGHARRIGQVKSRVEHGDLRQVGPDPLRQFDRCQIGRVVQGRQRGQRRQTLDQGGVQRCRAMMIWPAMRNPVADGVDALNAPIRQHLRHGGNGLTQIRVKGVAGLGPVTGPERKGAASILKPLEPALETLHGVRSTVEHTEFQAGTARVEHQNAHDLSFKTDGCILFQPAARTRRDQPSAAPQRTGGDCGQGRGHDIEQRDPPALAHEIHAGIDDDPGQPRSDR